MRKFVHEFTWTAPAAREATFAALTKPEALRSWFAEHVEIEPVKEGAFKFWGKHTLGSPSKDQAIQRVTEFAADQSFGFDWTLMNCESNVLIALADGEKPGETKVNVRHEFERLPDIGRAKEMIDDLWRLNGGNFVAYLKGGEGICLPNYDDADPEIRQSIVIDAPRETVFKALVTPELLAKWMWAEGAEVDARIGGKYSYGWNYKVDGKDVAGGPTKILDYVENEKLVTDWPDWRGDSSVPIQTVTWMLEDAGAGKTRVTVIHAGFARAVDFSDYPFGWADFLGGLKSVAEAA